jgi:molybdate transport system substrate-binding protein
VFAANELVLAVAPGSPIDSVDDLARPGVKLVIGAEGVPVGDYARELLDRLPPDRRQAIAANIRSEEADVKGIVGKVAQGAADAGFAYSSDVAAAPDDLEAVALPARLAPRVAYAIAIVVGADDPQAARAFVAGLVDGAGRRALREAGLRPPPGR